MAFSKKRALLRWGENSSHKISYIALQYKFLSFIDAPSNSGSLNESPLVDKFGSIKTVWSIHTAPEPLTGTLLNSCSSLFPPYLSLDHLSYVVAYSHIKL